MRGGDRRRDSNPTSLASPPAPFPWRLIRDRPSGAAWNMAVDEAILERYADGSQRAPTLRLYGWSPPAVSLGRNQAARGAHAPDYLSQEGIDLVRRPTGGLAVLHEHERTYAVIGTLGRPPFEGGVLATYLAVSRAVLSALETLGVPARAEAPGAADVARERSPGPSCFEVVSAHEISVLRRKLVGSAQLRRRRAFLQHGSIPIRGDSGRVARALGTAARTDRFTDLERSLGRTPNDDEIDVAMRRGFERTLGISLRDGSLTANEIAVARELSRTRYVAPRWTLRR